MLKHYFVSCVLLFLVACSPADKVEINHTDKTQQTVSSENTESNTIQSGIDYHSFANPQQIQVTHIDLNLTADFSAKQLRGLVKLSFERKQKNAKELILDTRQLDIQNVTSDGAKIPFSLMAEDAELGAALHIALPNEVNTITIAYATSPQATGVQWLSAAQTAGKQHPFLFTQAQAIHARSFIPLQDSPSVRITYTAKIHTPPELLAVMSAANDPKTPRDGSYEFTMPQPIPSYLIALAIGDLQFKPMGERTGVYAEPSILNTAIAEFADTESMLLATEAKYGAYSWGRYDLLILPPSFPFGGMENPRLSFITPTVIAGDKSLVSLIAHELAHSWSGNTVTNATWRDLWLNEGFTTYLTYRIMEMIYGVEREKMEATLGYQDLLAEIASLPEKEQILAIDLRGRNPDDVFSNIPYEKGALFLREIEYKIGRDNFDAFLLQYFADFAFQSITTDEFIDYLDRTLLAQYPNKLDKARITEWIFSSGLPEGAPKPESDVFAKIDNLREGWLTDDIKASEIETTHWTVHEWLYFLNNLPKALSTAQMQALDKAFALTQSKNNEIAHSWLLMAIRNQYQPAYPRLHEYLVSIGRNKLISPLYKALAQTSEGKRFAAKAFAEAKAGYHPLTIYANEPYVLEEANN